MLNKLYKISNNILVALILISISLLSVGFFIREFINNDKIYYQRIIEPSQNTTYKSFDIFKNNLELFGDNVLSSFCEQNLRQKINIDQLDQSKKNPHQSTDMYRESYQVSIGFNINNKVLNCESYKTISPKSITKSVTQVFVNIKKETSNQEKNILCSKHLKSVDKNIINIEFKEIDDNLTICEGSIE